MSQTATLAVPAIDSEIEDGVVMNYQSVLNDIASGKMDTASLNEIADGSYPADLIGCRFVTRKDKDGAARFPQVAFQVRTADWTTTSYKDFDARPNMAFKIRDLLKTFLGLLGPSGFAAVQAPTVEGSDWEKLCLHVKSLAEAVQSRIDAADQHVNFSVRRTPNKSGGDDYVNANITRRAA